ncbi:MAG: DUF126 domain-containing protein [Oscillospiraceae bacterium]
MKEFVLQGRGVFAGTAEAEALVCPESIQGWAGIDDQTGKIIERGHSQEGKSITGKILVLPCSKGSNGWSCHFHSAAVKGEIPAGWIFTKLDSRAGVATAVLKIPTASDFGDVDPCAVIQTGDLLRMDGTTGTVYVSRKN